MMILRLTKRAGPCPRAFFIGEIARDLPNREAGAASFWPSQSRAFFLKRRKSYV